MNNMEFCNIKVCFYASRGGFFKALGENFIWKWCYDYFEILLVFVYDSLSSIFSLKLYRFIMHVSSKPNTCEAKPF